MVDLVASRISRPMAPNITVENTIQDVNRLLAGDERLDKHQLEHDYNQREMLKLDGSMIDLKERKLLFKQKPLTQPASFRRHLLNFETFLLDAEESGSKVTSIPEEHWEVLVLAGHESSARTESLFIKHLRSALKVPENAKDILPDEAFLSVLPKLFTLHDYGYLPADFSSSSLPSFRIPAGLQIRCWEAREPSKMFSVELCAIYNARNEERTKARAAHSKLLESMNDLEKIELLKGEKGKKREVLTMASEEPPRVGVKRRGSEGTTNTANSTRSASPIKKGKMSVEAIEASRLRKEERCAMKATRADEKAAAERDEVEKKRTVMAKQAQKISSFFKTTPAAPPNRLVSRASPAGPSSCKDPDPIAMSDFHRAFKPVVQRATVEWADINEWVKHRLPSLASETHFELPHQVGHYCPMSSEEVEAGQRCDFLDDHFTRHGLRSRSSRKHIPQGLRSATPYGTVLDIWNAHQDASDPRKVLNQLKDRRRFPWKTLAFDQHIRPPYSGTFTKKSAVVGPRTPLAQDPIFDYTYDSGDDWQDDGGGDDVDDFDEAAGQEESDEEESDGEFDDWLDDAEDEHYVPMDIVAEDMPVQTDVVPPSIERTQLGLKAIRKPREVPKRSVKISPYWRGPIWESEVGERIEGFGDYRLQLLNDTPGSVNPFTYIASSPKDTLKGQYSTIVVGNNLSVRCLLSTDVVTIDKKCTPGRLVGVETVHATSTSDGDSSSVTRALPKRPKVAFPTAHLPELLRLIEGNPKTRNDLVSQLKAHFDSITSKAAIEAKIREVASRQGQAKDSQWRVRPEAWLAAELSVPDSAIMVANS